VLWTGSGSTCLLDMCTASGGGPLGQPRFFQPCFHVKPFFMQHVGQLGPAARLANNALLTCVSHASCCRDRAARTKYSSMRRDNVSEKVTRIVTSGSACCSRSYCPARVCAVPPHHHHACSVCPEQTRSSYNRIYFRKHSCSGNRLLTQCSGPFSFLSETLQLDSSARGAQRRTSSSVHSLVPQKGANISTADSSWLWMPMVQCPIAQWWRSSRAQCK